MKNNTHVFNLYMLEKIKLKDCANVKIVNLSYC